MSVGCSYDISSLCHCYNASSFLYSSGYGFVGKGSYELHADLDKDFSNNQFSHQVHAARTIAGNDCVLNYTVDRVE